MNANPGMMVTLRIVGHIEYMDKSFESGDIKVRIKEHYNLTVSTPPRCIAFPGEVRTYNILIKNNGKSDDLFSLSIKNEVGWNVSYQVNENRAAPFIEGIAIKSGECKNITVNVEIPLNALAGTHEILVVIKSKGGLEQNITITSIVRQIHSFELDLNTQAIQDDDGYMVELSKSNYITISARNKGNGYDTLKLIINNVPEFWNLSFYSFSVAKNVTALDPGTETRIELPPYETGYITICVKTPGEGVRGNYSFTVLGENQYILTGLTPLVVPLLLSVSDLELIGDLEVSNPRPCAGEEVTVEVTVHNRFHVDASNLTAKLYVGSKEVDRFEIATIPPHDNMTITLKWIAEEGIYPIGVVLEGEMIPIEEQPKNFTVIKVSKKETSTDLSASYLWMSVVLILIMIVGGIILLRGRRKTSREIEKTGRKSKAK